jgi:glycosyltransferase involved in cell wall biosynthesis
VSTAEAPDRPLRIVHVNTHDEEGGAAKVARQLCQLQRRAGHTAHLLVGQRKTRFRGVRRLDPRPEHELEYFCQEANLQDLELQGSHDLDLHPLVAAADVLHLHNMHGGYLNPASVAVLSRSKPTVWTLHDLQGLTGFCHHPLDCEGWLSDCARCLRQSMDRPWPLHQPGTLKAAMFGAGAATCLGVKRAAYGASVLDIACPSQWVADRAGAGILGGQRLHVVQNAVNTRAFSPRDKAKARERLGLPQDAFLVGAVAISGIFDNPLKGGHLAQPMLDRLRELVPGALLVNIGARSRNEREGVIGLPFQHTERDMAWAYAALDALVHLSLAETFCLVAAEALSCGRPVLAFDIGPLPGVVRHGVDGLLAPAGDALALAELAARLAVDPALARRMGEAGRKGALERFDLAVLDRGYMGLYRRAMAEHPARLAATPPLDPVALPAFLRTPALLAGIARAGGQAVPASSPKTIAGLVEQYLAEETDDAKRRPLAFAWERALAYPRVFVLRSEKRWADALRLLEELLADAPEDRRLLRTYGVTLGLSGRVDLALKAFARCIEADRLLNDVHLTISDMYRFLGDADKSWQALDDMAVRDPAIRGLALRRGILLEQRGDAHGAAAMYQREFDLHGDANAGRKAKELGAGAACPAGQPERPATARSARTKAPAKRGRGKKGN